MGDETDAVSPKPPLGDRMKRATDGAFGAGLVLIVFPSVALIFGIRDLSLHPVVGLTVLAIFGIMILFGALALISTVFARLSLSAPGEALALPPGSIRAVIAFSLIVLFAIVSVMLYQSLNQPYAVEHLTADQKEAVIKEPRNQVLAVIVEACKTPQADDPTACDPKNPSYTVHLRLQAGSEGTDLAKQMLVIIATLVTSVTSFYFASRSTETATKSMFEALGWKAGESGTRPGAQTSKQPSRSDDAQEDGCDAVAGNPTADRDLPPATGGVAS